MDAIYGLLRANRAGLPQFRSAFSAQIVSVSSLTPSCTGFPAEAGKLVCNWT